MTIPRPVPDAEQAITLASYRLWLLKMATVLAPHRPHEWHDLAQEGWVAMWRALKTHDPSRGALPSWLTTAARMRMLEVLRRNNWTGTPGVRGHVREQPARPVDLTDPEQGWEHDPQLHAVENWDALLWAYHRGEIQAALARLKPRDRAYIEQRILADNNRFSWRQAVIPERVKSQLREDLAHLAAMA